MKTFVTIFLVLILSSEVKSQADTISSTDKKVNNRIQELKNTKVDTLVYYYINCIGSDLRLSSDTCVAYDTKYLLWSNHGKHYIQSFDKCKEHNVSEVNNDVFALLRNNYAEIKIAKIRYPRFTVKENGKLKTYYSYIDHSCHNIFEIYTNNRILKKDMDDYALEAKYDEEKHLNRNFYSNQKSILNKLKIMVEHDVEVYNRSQ